MRSLSRMYGAIAAVLGAFVLASGPAAAAPVEYAVTDLGVLPGGDQSIGFDIGSGLSAVGNSTTAAGNTEAFYWVGGSMVGLGALPGFANSRAEGLTEFGPSQPVAVGWCYNTLGPSTDARAFASAFGHVFDLGTLGGSYSLAHAIAGQGFIVGESQLPPSQGQVPSDIWHAFRTEPFSVIDPATDDLGTLAGATSSYAEAVNNVAQVTGQSGGHAYRTAPFSKINPATDDLGTIGGIFSIGFGINQAGVVVGLSNTGDTSATTGEPIDHAFLYDTGMHDLGTVPGYENSTAGGINDHGQVVGWVANLPSDFHAMIWDKKRGMRDLNLLIAPHSGWVLQSARAINSRGEIAGWGMHHGALRAFILRPLPHKGP